MHDAFISYSSEDRSVATSVCSALEASGFRCWIAPRNIAPGAIWAEAIVEGLSGSRVVVVVFSSHADRSAHVMREVERAVARSVPILPFRVEDVEPTGAMEYFLSAQHWLDAFQHSIDVHVVELAQAIERTTKATVRDDVAATNRSVLRLASAGGDSAAATSLGLLASERGDQAEAERWLRQGADGGDVMAATTLGLLAKERGDQAEAERWLRQGADAGDVMAATTLGLLAKERGDQAEAERWLRQGADAGDVMAATTLGLLAKERGDHAEAERWLRQGADGGDVMAATELRRLQAGDP